MLGIQPLSFGGAESAPNCRAILSAQTLYLCFKCFKRCIYAPGPPRAAQSPRSEFAEDFEEDEGLSSEGPELLDFRVDEVAEQLTLMDVVGTPASGRVGGQGRPVLMSTHPSYPFLPYGGALLARAYLRMPGFHVVSA